MTRCPFGTVQSGRTSYDHAGVPLDSSLSWDSSATGRGPACSSFTTSTGRANTCTPAHRCCAPRLRSLRRRQLQDRRAPAATRHPLLPARSTPTSSCFAPRVEAGCHRLRTDPPGSLRPYRSDRMRRRPSSYSSELKSYYQRRWASFPCTCHRPAEPVASSDPRDKLRDALNDVFRVLLVPTARTATAQRTPRMKKTAKAPSRESTIPTGKSPT